MVAYSDHDASLAFESTISVPMLAPAPTSLWGTWRTKSLMTHTSYGPRQCILPSFAQFARTLPEPQNTGTIVDDYKQWMGFYPRVIQASAGPYDLGSGDNHNAFSELVARQDSLPGNEDDFMGDDEERDLIDGEPYPDEYIVVCNVPDV